MHCRFNPDLLRDLFRRLGETVTIYTTSGGDSGSGFTGVLVGVNCDFVTLLSAIGPAPSCALGSCCNKKRKCKKNHFDEDAISDDELGNQNQNNRINCNLRNIGAVVNIPTDKIAAVVFNTLR